MCKTKTTESEKEKIAQLIKADLDSYFQERFSFGPIVVHDRTDQYGDPFIYAEIVFDGEGLLDSKWTLGLYQRLIPHLEEMRIELHLSKTFIGAKEWPTHLERLERFKHGIR